MLKIKNPPQWEEKVGITIINNQNIINIISIIYILCFTVNQEHSDEPNLELLHTRMQNFAEVARYKPLELLPSLGELVLAYSRFKFWYRARIIDVGEYKAKVLFSFL